MEIAESVGLWPDWYARLRQQRIATRVQTHRLIRDVMACKREALRLFFPGYVHYVRDFGAHIVAREPYGSHPIAHEVARAIGIPVHVQQVSDHINLLRKLDGSHFALWTRMAESMGVVVPPAASAGPAMEQLVATMKNLGAVSFYVALATIEAIAVALAHDAFQSPLGQQCDARWFEVHLTRHKPTNEGLYVWLALCLMTINGIGGEAKRKRFETDALGILELFIGVADELAVALQPEPAL